MTANQALPWRLAMNRALYGEGGLYRASGAPAHHFRTSAHASGQFAAAVRTLADRVHGALGRPAELTVVDMGAGDGALLIELARLVPDRWTLVGVDVAPRPIDLPARIGWRADLPVEVCGLVIANEYLDVVGLDVVELTPDGPRLVRVTPAGEESLGPPPPEPDAAWVDRWSPLRDVGDRAEIGRTRDDAWRSLTSRLSRGVAVAIDYATEPGRGRAGTLTGYRDGRQVRPVPDGGCDLTAHVCFDSMTAPGDVVLSQRKALLALGIRADRPAYDADPAAYLSGLAAAADTAELLDPAGLGGFTWLVHHTAEVVGQVFAAD